MNTWGVRGTLAAVGVATVIAGLGGAGIYAATGATSHAMGGHGGFGGPGGPPGPGGPGGGGRGGDGQAAHPAADPLHSETVVQIGDGQFRTELVQTGSLTAIDATSVSAHSADGFTQTYVIPATLSRAPLSPGDDVTIHATRTGGTSTVSMITPRTKH